jgi:membrane-associated phospholipid phosphatase
MSFLKILAKAISIILHPILIVTYGLLFLIWMNPFAFGSTNFQNAMAVYDVMVIRIFMSTALLPAFGIFIMKYLGIVEDFNMDDNQERIGPYIATSIFYLWIFYNIYNNPELPDIFKIFMLGSTIGLFVAFFINNFSKISAYTVGMGVLLAMGISHIFSDTSQNLILALQIIFVLAGLMGTARLILKTEHPSDVYGGYMAGVISYIVGSFTFTTFLV